MKRRDAEIQRRAVKAEKGPDANQMNLRFKNETNESIILQLNSQASGVKLLSRPFCMVNMILLCLGTHHVTSVCILCQCKCPNP